MNEKKKTYIIKRIEDELRYFIKDPSSINYSLVAEELANQIDWKRDVELLHKGFSWLAWQYKN